MAVTDRAITAIKDMITSGELRPGDRLPPEKELSERLGLSRNSLREAVKALAVIRVLDVRQGDGTYVTSLSPALLLEVLGFVIDLSRDHTVLDMMRVRRMLEPEATAAAALRIDEEQLDRLDAVMEPLGPDSPVADLVEADLQFHALINAASGNAYLASLLGTLADATLRARIWRGHTQRGSVGNTIDEHRQILTALRTRQPDLARSWAAIHVAGVEGWILGATPDDVPGPSDDTRVDAPTTDPSHIARG